MGLPLSAAVTLGLLFFLSVGLNKQVAEGCRCIPKGLQQALCQSDTVIRAKITGQVKNPQQTEYSIKMIEAFKHINKKRIRVIYSKQDSCEIYLENKEYLLAGNVRDGMIFVNQCDLVKQWDSVSSDEKQYLRMCPTGCDCIKIKP